MVKYWKFWIVAGQFLRKKENLLIEAINDALDYIKRRIDEKTPEDTENLVKHNTIIKARKVGEIIVGSVVNKTGYGVYVEYGRSKQEGVPTIGIKFKYNKPKGKVFYEGVGARMFTRTADEERDFIINLIKTKVLWKR